MRTAKSIEEAIEVVLSEKTECKVDWYEAGKTNADLIDYLKERGIDADSLGVFIAGDRDCRGSLTFMPAEWMVPDGSAPSL